MVKRAKNYSIPVSCQELSGSDIGRRRNSKRWLISEELNTKDFRRQRCKYETSFVFWFGGQPRRWPWKNLALPGTTGRWFLNRSNIKSIPYLFLWLWSVLWSCRSRCFCPQPQENRLNINMSEIVTVGLDFEFREYLNKLKSGSSLYTWYPRVFLWKRQCFKQFSVRNAFFW